MHMHRRKRAREKCNIAFFLSCHVNYPSGEPNKAFTRRTRTRLPSAFHLRRTRTRVTCRTHTRRMSWPRRPLDCGCDSIGMYAY